MLLLLFVTIVTFSCQKNESQNPSDVINTTETRTGGYCTPESGPNCKDSIFTNVNLVVSGCTLKVSYKVTQCQIVQTLPYVKIHISDFKIENYGTGTACQQIKFILTPPVNGSYEKWYVNNYNPFYKKLSILIENIEIEKAKAAGFISPCTWLLGTSTVDWIESGCYKVCPGPKDAEGFAFLISVKCGVGCCFRTTPVCQSQNNEIIKGEPAYVTGPAVCDPIPNGCPDNINNKCRPACDRL